MYCSANWAQDLKFTAACSRRRTALHTEQGYQGKNVLITMEYPGGFFSPDPLMETTILQGKKSTSFAQKPPETSRADLSCATFNHRKQPVSSRNSSKHRDPEYSTCQKKID